MKPELIVMLTYNDKTVKDALKIFEMCKDTKAKYFGIKESGIPSSEMKKLFDKIKRCGKYAVLETVAYTEGECISGASLAAECGCDILMGTLFYDSVNSICKNNGIKYMPFIGKVSQRPSVLEGDIDSIIREAEMYKHRGVYGFDLLAYRYKNAPESLISRFVSEVSLPACIAGSIDSLEKIDAVISSGAWAFTVGGGFFDNKFGLDIASQINTVCDYILSKE